MIKPQTFKINDYLNTCFPCSCLKEHKTELKQVIIRSGAIQEIPSLINKYKYKQILVVCDINTHVAAGIKIMEILKIAEICASIYIFDSENLVPDEAALGQLLAATDNKTDLIIAVGTGTLNDLCKYLSFRLGIDYFSVATAPSMDGFASIGAALIVNNLKVTYDAHCPKVIIGDLDILCRAPMDMIAAGLADILGKYTCLIDWKMAHIICGEYYCPNIAGMVRESIRRVVHNAKLVSSRKPEVIAAIMEALVLTGIAMSFAGNSRPASGSEHHLSHFWEMKFLFEGKKPVLHGTKVGIGTIASTHIYNQLIAFDIGSDFSKNSNLNQEQWQEEIGRVYGKAAEGVIELERNTGKNSVEGKKHRLEVMKEVWPQIISEIKESLPDLQYIEELLKSLNAPVNPFQVGIDYGTVVDSITYAKEVRNRFTVLQILWDLGILEETAEKTADYFKVSFYGE